ncbi:MAG: hypothetical protein GY729_05810 [Desulfobacteraceae bacterium]|nr:hypothetical protein [Desulfobacteraceae bacterium]
MSNENENFKMKKTFGLGVLMKLTKKNINGITISTSGDKFVSNVSFGELQDAVNNTLTAHNIHLKID